MTIIDIFIIFIFYLVHSRGVQSCVGLHGPNRRRFTASPTSGAGSLEWTLGHVRSTGNQIPIDTSGRRELHWGKVVLPHLNTQMSTIDPDCVAQVDVGTSRQCRRYRRFSGDAYPQDA